MSLDDHIESLFNEENYDSVVLISRFLRHIWTFHSFFKEEFVLNDSGIIIFNVPNQIAY